ncbi:MAG: hypothetical protein A2X86_07770 [Bdellovibrionales bacterium GWA2_49_15]|nr:MAG: hypothetical protein A2X86_07770 [Bdellovibrionales bacterium GWA2_49_15]HAZ11824.1 hypothetical protein [Bdellovibrionales bacterium]
MSKNIKLGILCLFLFATSGVVAQAKTCIYQEKPTTQHLVDAIHLNKERKKLYRQHFGTEASQVFAEVMLYEHLMLPFARILDWQAKPFLCAGVEILRNDLVSIHLTPIFSSSRKMPQSFEKPDDRKAVVSLKKRLRQAIDADQAKEDPHFTETLGLLTRKIQELQLAPHVNCLQRHFLESAALALTHAAAYAEKAKELGIKSTLPLSIKFARVHLQALGIMARLDRNAYPLQKEGIPIFCQDIPPIHL